MTTGMIKYCFFVMLWFGAFLGCQTYNEKNFYDVTGWKSRDYFDDSKVIALIDAIEAEDLERVKNEIESGARVNSVGVDGMTPLLWALVRKNAEIFAALVEAGADPAVVVKSNFNTKGVIAVGTSVAHMAAFHKRADFFLILLEHGLDPDLRASIPQQDDGQATLFDAILSGDYRMGGKSERIRERIDGLILLRPCQEVLDDAVEHAIGASKFAIAEALFKAGANPHRYTSSWGNMLHFVVERVPNQIDPERQEYEHLMSWLVEKGEDLESARKDVARWHSQAKAAGDPNKAAAARKTEIEKTRQLEELKITTKNSR